MNKLYALLFLGFLASSCTKSPCATKDDFKGHFRTFIKEYDDKYENLSKDQKAEYNDRFNKLVDECYKKYKPEMTLKERQYFWRDAVLFLAMNNSERDGESISFNTDSYNMSPYVKAEFESILKESGENFRSTIKTLIAEELPKVIDVIVDEVEKIGNEVKKALESADIELKGKVSEKE